MKTLNTMKTALPGAVCIALLMAVPANAKEIDYSKIIKSGNFPYMSANGIGSYAEVLADKSFDPQLLVGKIYLPKLCNEGNKVPAVIIQHGSGAPKHRWYPKLAKNLINNGIAALIANSFSQREIVSTARDQTQLTGENRLYDAFAAFRALQKVSCVNPDRIGITGYSFGGIVSMHAVESIMAQKLGSGHIFKATLPVYPSCIWRWRESNPTETKVHLLLAELDDYTPAKYCLEDIPRLKKSGWDISYTVYPDTHHGFIADKWYGYDAENQTFNSCGAYWVTAEGHTENDRIKASTKDGRDNYVKKVLANCVQKGTTVGRNKKTQKMTMDFTVKFFKENL